MTIPRIGDKIDRVSAQVHHQDNMEQIVPQESITRGKTDISAENIQDSGQPIQPETAKNNTEVKNETTPEADSAQTAAPEPKEYSIEQFTKDFNRIFQSEVLKMLQPYEAVRKSTFWKAAISSGAIIAIAIIYFNVPEQYFSGDLFWSIIGGGLATWCIFKKQFELKIKRKIMPVLMKAVPNFSWREPFKISQIPLFEQIMISFAPKGKTAKKYMRKAPIPTEEISKAMLFPYDNNCTKTFDDCFVGKYRGVDIVISECTYGLSKKTVFSGAVIRIKMNKKFEGLTVLRPKKNIEVKNVKDLKKEGLQQIKLEDININKTYDVYSTDQIEARYLLTTSFIDRFQHITTAFNSKVSFCSFYGDYVYIAPFCLKDLFSLGSLIKPVTDPVQYRKLFEEFVSILALVDHFKIDKKLGL